MVGHRRIDAFRTRVHPEFAVQLFDHCSNDDAAADTPELYDSGHRYAQIATAAALRRDDTLRKSHQQPVNHAQLSSTRSIAEMIEGQERATAVVVRQVRGRMVAAVSMMIKRDRAALPSDRPSGFIELRDQAQVRTIVKTDFKEIGRMMPGVHIGGAVRQFVTCLAWAVLLAGCARPEPVEVSTFYGPGVKYHGIGTAFTWNTATPTDSPERLVGSVEFQQLVRTTVERELGAKGFRVAVDGPPDFHLDYRVGRQEKTDSQFSAHGEVVQEGALVLEVLDPATGNLIWCGIAKARINDADPPEVREERITRAVQELAKEFPSK